MSKKRNRFITDNEEEFEVILDSDEDEEDEEDWLEDEEEDLATNAFGEEEEEPMPPEVEAEEPMDKENPEDEMGEEGMEGEEMAEDEGGPTTPEEWEQEWAELVQAHVEANELMQSGEEPEFPLTVYCGEQRHTLLNVLDGDSDLYIDEEVEFFLDPDKAIQKGHDTLIIVTLEDGRMTDPGVFLQSEGAAYTVSHVVDSPDDELHIVYLEVSDTPLPGKEEEGEEVLDEEGNPVEYDEEGEPMEPQEGEEMGLGPQQPMEEEPDDE
jgi:hypothetical protein